MKQLQAFVQFGALLLLLYVVVAVTVAACRAGWRC